MRKKSCFFFVLFWLLCVSAPVFAQDAVSATLPAPWTSHLGGQLIYFFEDGTVNGGTPSGSRGT